jgi:Flp pilus assembly protein TadG
MLQNPRRPRTRRGNAIIEFGLAFPLLFLFLSGMYQFGYAFFIYNELQSAIRAGARFASTADFDAGGDGSTFRNRVRNVVVYGSPDGGSSPLVQGLGPSNVNVTWSVDAKGIPQTVTVAINGYTFYAVFRTFTIPNKPRATFIYLGQYVSG